MLRTPVFSVSYLLPPTSCFLESPPQQHRTNGEPRADRREQHEVAPLQFSIGHGIGERQRNSRPGRVAEALEIDDHLGLGQPEPLGRRVDDAAVRLVRDEQIQL